MRHTGAGGGAGDDGGALLPPGRLGRGDGRASVQPATDSAATTANDKQRFDIIVPRPSDAHIVGPGATQMR
jgi:hypothetical protein